MSVLGVSVQRERGLGPEGVYKGLCPGESSYPPPVDKQMFLKTWLSLAVGNNLLHFSEQSQLNIPAQTFFFSTDI